MGEGRGAWQETYAAGPADAFAIYEDLLVPSIFEPWAGLLVDLLDPPAGSLALDVATGPGPVARALARRVGPSGSVVGIDVSAGMLALACAKPPVEGGAPVHYAQSQASSLPLAAGSFHLVTCQQGLQFFPDPLLALGEVARVLVPDGRLGVSVWASIERCPAFAALRASLTDVLGPEVAVRFTGPWSLAEDGVVAAMVADAGFVEVHREVVKLPMVLGGGLRSLLALFLVTGVADDVRHLDDRTGRELERAVAHHVGPLLDNGVVRSAMTSQVVMARRWR